MLHITAFNAAGDHLPPVQFKRCGNIINITLADTAESQLAGARRHGTIQPGQQGDTAVRCMGLRGKCHSGIVNTIPRPARRRSLHTIGMRQTSTMTQGWLARWFAISYVPAYEADFATAHRI